MSFVSEPKERNRSDVVISSSVNRGLEPRSGQTKEYRIGICCLSAKHRTIRRKNKDCLYHANVSEWSDVSIRGLLFQ